MTALGTAGMAGAATPGTLNSSFGSAGIATLAGNTRIFGDAFQSDGKLVVVGQRGTSAGSTLIVGRLSGSGALDGSFAGGLVNGPAVTSHFGTGSVGRGVAIQGDGKIVVVGKATDSSGTGTLGMLIERFNSNGSLDSSFGSGGVARALAAQFGDGTAVAVAPDGKIVAAGTANSTSGGTVVAVVRLNANGSLDSSFGSGGIDTLNLGTDSRAQGVALQTDGKIVIVGSQAPGLQVPNALIARLTPSGALDPSFAGGGAYGHQYAIGAANSSFNAAIVEPNGTIVAAGAATNGNSGADAVLARFTPAGAPDPSFGSGGVVRTTSATNTTVENAVPGANALAVASNGDLIAGGTESNSGTGKTAVWAFHASGAPDNAFGSGGVAIMAFGSNVAQGSAVAISPTGQIAVAGDAGSEGASPAGVVVGYNGFSSAPPPSSSLKLSLSKLAGTDKISAVTKHGLKVTVGCNVACSIRVSLRVSSATARRLRILTSYSLCTKKHGKKHCKKAHAYRATTIASATGKLSTGGTKSITIKLSRSLAATLKKQKKVSVTLQVSATDSSTHKTKTITKGLTFKR